jgi:surface carbohydrate biosynthesis protein
MIVKIKKFWYKFCYFIRAKKKWSLPRQSKVLIYDVANRETLLEYLKPWHPEVLHVRNEQINMWVFLKSLFREGSRVNAYIDSFIEAVCPCLIVTFVDNNSTFYRISQRHPDIKTLVIQNGMRGYYNDIFEVFDHLDSDALSAFFVDYMLVFGSAVGGQYSRYIKGSIAHTGSIKNNFVLKEMSTQPGVIAFVSEWRLYRSNFAMGTYSFDLDDFCLRPDSLVLQCLMNYASKNNKKLMIIPSQRYDRDILKQEKDYFRKAMGCEPEFLEPSGSYPGYQAIDSAEIVVALESTLVYESIARGKKAAILPIRGTMSGIPNRNFGYWSVGIPDEGFFWTIKPDLDNFVRILDYLFEVSDEQWKKDVESTNFSSIMEYDPGNTILKSILDKELGPPPRSAS